jgi:hypothetical protein
LWANFLRPAVEPHLIFAGTTRQLHRSQAHSADVHGRRVKRCRRVLLWSLRLPGFISTKSRRGGGSEGVTTCGAPSSSFLLAVPTLAEAQIVAKINLSSQRMVVIVDGKARYNWRYRRRAAATGRPPAPSSRPRSSVTTAPRSCRIRSSSCAVTPSTGHTRSSISGDRPRMAALDCTRKMRPLCILSCKGADRATP